MEDITKKLNVKFLRNEPLSNFTYTKTGGCADLVAFPKTLDDVSLISKYANKNNVPLTIIGNASNLIIKDGGIRGIVMILRDIKEIKKISDNSFVAGAGATYIDASIFAQKHALSGLEFAAGIPGSVGGAVYMNAGAYGGETAQVIESVKIIDENGSIKDLSKAEMNFGYRHSLIQDKKYIVLAATFVLKSDDENLIQSRMDHFNALRFSKQPLNLPSCGSVFKRPEGHFAGKLIHDAGLQGFQLGGAQVSTKHAGFIVNVDHATATDYLDVIKHVQSTVYKNNKIHLETEVKIIGED
ncbi:UDP-N-acetylmuramate dehydrogenase [Apilactobacillus xinyiensis]|uniref:UDP-N-acetylmuramate dehydrogenase n=1 Tax=Apilactobacillus xinyiensis TaxID=2841032 RepID=UPI00200BDFEB|nr:UDP-N-acetylmuramate dehydrogenase [Apilactobacillus xinyiensis]MCL0330112.1 UDP-N-acetylmuramate dehydrogenase [Apilactobacillus xinyiensis]